jgi:hypothetical protein
MWLLFLHIFFLFIFTNDNIKGFNFANNVLIGKNGTEKKYGGTEATYNTVTTREVYSSRLISPHTVK